MQQVALPEDLHVPLPEKEQEVCLPENGQQVPLTAKERDKPTLQSGPEVP